MNSKSGGGENKLLRKAKALGGPEQARYVKEN